MPHAKHLNRPLRSNLQEHRGRSATNNHQQQPDKSGTAHQRRRNGRQRHSLSPPALLCSARLCASGGKKVLICGIFSLAVGVGGFVAAYLAYRRDDNKFRMLSLAAWMVAGALAMLAVILYSNETVQLGYSYILYLFAAFTSLFGTTVILFGPGVNK